MRARWRRCAALGLSACCLPLALRLLLLTRNYSDGPLLIVNSIGQDTDGYIQLEERQEELVNGDKIDFKKKHLDYQQQHGLFYFAGAYMHERRPGNVSYCRWQYELPDSISYVEQELIGSPESVSGSHRVLAYVIRGESDPPLPQLTLCSHASADQVYGVVELAKRWEGPLGIAVYAPGHDAGLAVKLLDRACRCEPAMAKVSVHLIFPRDRPPLLTNLDNQPITNQQLDCSASDLQTSNIINSTERHKSGLSYPINIARNVARSLAATQRVLVSDVELLPSEKLASRFLTMLHGRMPKRALAFVLPVFEVEAGEPVPRNKKELLDAMRAGVAVYFHRFSCPHCQRFPGLTRWILRPDPGRVRPLIITKREYPHHRWEPIFIGTKHDPLYTEEMSWEGRQDKMTQMFEMCLMNYRLIILDGAFLVHTPGIKRKYTTQQSSSSISLTNQDREQRTTDRQRAYERQNARIYQRVTRRLLKQYPTNRRCRA